MHLYFLSSEDWILSVAWVSWLFAYSLRGRCQGAIVVILTSGSSVDKSTSKLMQVVGRIASFVCRTEVPVPCWLLVRGHSHLLEATAYFGSCLLITIFHTSRGEPSQASVPSDFLFCHIPLPGLQFHSSGVFIVPLLVCPRSSQLTRDENRDITRFHLCGVCNF